MGVWSFAHVAKADSGLPTVNGFGSKDPKEHIVPGLVQKGRTANPQFLEWEEKRGVKGWVTRQWAISRTTLSAKPSHECQNQV